MARMRGYRHAILLGGLVVCSCGLQQKARGPTTPRSSSLREVAAATLSAEADRDRMGLVKTELDRLKEHPMVFSARELQPRERRFLAVLHGAAEVVEDLALLQDNPKMLEYRRGVEKTGMADDRRLFLRNRGPWCLSVPDVRCCALRSMPPRAVGLHGWPADMTDKDFRSIKSASNASALLSPYTLVRRRGKKLVAVAPAKDPLLGPHVKKLTALLRRAARHAENESLQKYLRARATSPASRITVPLGTGTPPSFSSFLA